MPEGTEGNEILQWLVSTLSNQMSQVFDTMAGEAPLIEAEVLARTPDEADTLVSKIAMSLAPSGPILLCASKAAWSSLGNRVLTAAGLDGSDPHTTQDTFDEAMDQAFSGLGREMSVKAGREVTCSAGKLNAAAIRLEGSWHRLQLIFGDNTPATLTIGFPDELVEQLRAAGPTPPLSPTAPVAAVSTDARAGPTEPRTLDVLLDVELPVSVSFGRAHLPLKEVMKLTTGSIVELNRTISEPVDIIVNNCVIARGEVVVVEGNFGVRIQEVISRQDRLRTLY